jgi:hypothetical protein
MYSVCIVDRRYILVFSALALYVGRYSMCNMYWNPHCYVTSRYDTGKIKTIWIVKNIPLAKTTTYYPNCWVTSSVMYYYTCTKYSETSVNNCICFSLAVPVHIAYIPSKINSLPEAKNIFQFSMFSR